MSRNTDSMIARYMGEMEERRQFIDGLVEKAQNEQRDLDEKEMELVTRARDRIKVIDGQLAPLEESSRIASDSQERIAGLAKFLARDDNKPTEMEYRSAGAYVLDRWKAGVGSDEAMHRLDLYHRAAAHQTTGDNPGLLPEQILGPVVNFVDEARPFVNALGVRQLPSGSWSRPQVTQHTQIGEQSAEKGELVSRKMLINKIPVAATTYGGYVNVSRQDVDWSQPGVMDVVINDLAGQYAIETENAATDDLTTAATAGPTIPTGPADADAIAGAFWAAAGSVYAAAQGQGRLIAVAGADMLGMLGPLFPPVNPANSQSAGFTAGQFGQGPVGNIAGIPVYVTAGMAANTILVLSTAAAEVYEDRIGSLQVVEPSVLGVQVAYAGYFATLPLLPAGIQKIVKTP